MEDIDTMKINLMREELEYFNPINGSVKDDSGCVKGYVYFSELENLYLYADSHGNLQFASSSGNRRDISNERKETYTNWRYYE